ncbi:MAG: radical SAM protein [Deltaproteobacteria bacterium]|nr:MAG: radical SAM protein [Deltaproteobacteria bacterium]
MARFALSPDVRRAARRMARAARMAVRAAVDPDRPVLAQIIPMRRCNLACSYCNEYDKVSDPVPTAEVMRWLDKLAELGTQIVTLSGGEPMLHPDVDQIIAGIGARGMISGLITNGYFLQVDRIRKLNDAGLEYLQISIDNVKPDDVSQKSLKVLDAKLVNLANHAAFHVNVNVVLGSGVDRPEDALTIARRARELGFATSVGIIHDGSGRLRPLSAEERRVYDEVTRTGLGMYNRIRSFQSNLIEGRPNDWRCRAGARYLYICEEGRVHYCSQQRGHPGIPLADYTVEDIRREFHTPKGCAPLCTIGCVHRASVLDGWRPQRG